MTIFVIEDEFHAGPQGEFANFEDALAELKRRAQIPWNQSPNCAPCTSWATCGREYVIIQCDDTKSPWEEIRRLIKLEISASGVAWSEDLRM